MSNLPQVYLDTVGQNMDPGRFGFDSLIALLRYLSGRVVEVSDSKKDPTIKQIEAREEELTLGFITKR